jgi:RNA 3'-terminal phosphate cyclase
VPKTKSDDDSPPDAGAGSHENWHGEKRSNDTHEFNTNSQARLFRKSRGTGAMLCYMGHVLTDSRHGLAVNTQVTQANGTAERDIAAETLADAAQFADTSITVSLHVRRVMSEGSGIVLWLERVCTILVLGRGTLRNPTKRAFQFD